jgi:hypothetical protein
MGLAFTRKSYLNPNLKMVSKLEIQLEPEN